MEKCIELKDINTLLHKTKRLQIVLLIIRHGITTTCLHRLLIHDCSFLGSVLVAIDQKHSKTTEVLESL